VTKKARHRLVAVIIVAFPFLLFLGFLIFMDAEPLPPVAPVPGDNGYENLVVASKTVADDTSDFDKMNETQLRGLVKRNSAALTGARAALQKQCAVPVQFTETYISNHLDDLSGIKRLSQAFAAEGMLAEMDGHTNEAVRSFLDDIRLGNASMRGGVLIDGLVGVAVDAIGTAHIQTLVPNLDAKSCRETAATLEELDSQSPAWNEIVQQENAWSERTFHGISYDYLRFRTRKSTATMLNKAKQKFETREQRTRELIIDLAARAYELDKGKAPASVSDLVPDYLKAIPQDPLTETNMVYLPK
jgi:uncharacterized protein YhaN